MPNIGWQERVEAEYGEKLITLVPRLLNEHERMRDVADLFKVDFMTIYRWCKANNVVKRPRYVIESVNNVTL